MTHNFARTLAGGDLIMVPYSNRLYPGIFRGYGKAGNIHFYMLRTEQYYKDNVINRINSGKKPYVDFINRAGTNLIAKIDPNEVEANLRVWYDEYKQLLISKGMI